MISYNSQTSEGTFLNFPDNLHKTYQKSISNFESELSECLRICITKF